MFFPIAFYLFLGSGTADDRLGLWDFADPKLIFGFAVAVPRYLLSTALKVGDSFLRSEFQEVGLGMVNKNLK